MHSAHHHCYVLKQMQFIFLADAIEDWRDGVWWKVGKLQNKYFHYLGIFENYFNLNHLLMLTFGFTLA